MKVTIGISDISFNIQYQKKTYKKDLFLDTNNISYFKNN